MPEQSTTSPQPVPTPPAAPVPVQQSAPPVSPTPVTLPTPSTPHSRKKALLLGFLAIISIIGIAAGAYTLGTQKTPKSVAAITPIPKQTSQSDLKDQNNWQTYEKEDAGFSFQYPPDWRVLKSIDFMITNQPDELKNKNVPYESGEGYISLSISTSSIDELIKNKPTAPITRATSSLDGRQVTLLERKDNAYGFNGEVYVKEVIIPLEDESILEIRLTSNSKFKEKYQAMLDQILSTFKFTDAGNAVDSSNWRTINKKHWQLKIPSNWHYLECSDEVQFFGKLEKDSKEDCGFDGIPGEMVVTKIEKFDATTILTNTANDPNYSIKNKSMIRVDGFEATKQQETYHEGQGAGTYIKVYIPSKSTIITLDDIGEGQTFDNILTTFKFTQ